MQQESVKAADHLAEINLKHERRMKIAQKEVIILIKFVIVKCRIH